MADLLTRLEGWLAALRDAYRTETARERQDSLQQSGWDPSSPPTAESFAAFLHSPYGQIVSGMAVADLSAPSGLPYRLFTEGDAVERLRQVLRGTPVQGLVDRAAEIGAVPLLAVAKAQTPFPQDILDHIFTANAQPRRAVSGAAAGVYNYFRTLDPSADLPFSLARVPAGTIAIGYDHPAIYAHELGHALNTAANFLTDRTGVRQLADQGRLDEAKSLLESAFQTAMLKRLAFEPTHAAANAVARLSDPNNPIVRLASSLTGGLYDLANPTWLHEVPSMLAQIAVETGRNPSLLSRTARRDISLLLDALDQRARSLARQGEVMRPLVDYLPQLLSGRQ